MVDLIDPADVLTAVIAAIILVALAVLPGFVVPCAAPIISFRIVKHQTGNVGAALPSSRLLWTPPKKHRKQRMKICPENRHHAENANFPHTGTGHYFSANAQRFVYGNLRETSIIIPQILGGKQ